jgi:hypothetical protein
MSHIVGTVQPVQPPRVIGPASGKAADAANTWSDKLAAADPPTGTTKLVILHFTAASFPGTNRLEVDLGYQGADNKDVFTAADGDDFWTRPVNIAAFPDKKVPIRYITTAGNPNAGGVTLDKYGRGERHSGDKQGSTTLSNCDPFLTDDPYPEPIYDPFWYCQEPPNWENIAKVDDAADIRRVVAPSVGMILHVDKSEHLAVEIDVLSTCTVTLIGPDLCITAGHCMAEPDEHVKSSSVIFNYETDKNGGTPNSYAPRFFKVKKVIAQHWDQSGGNVDFCVFQLAVAPSLPSVQMRHDIPGPGEEVFGIHHPNGAVKKLTIPHPGFAKVQESDVDHVKVPKDYHVSGGSSGGGLFDTAGRIVGVCADGNPCPNISLLRYYPSASILQQIEKPPVDPPATRDVMIVFDRSGSMGTAGASGRPKLEEAQDAASLFVQLVRAGTGNKVGLVSFSTSPNLDFSLHDATANNKKTLIGLAPFSGGKIGGLVADGATTIGGGLQTAGGNMPDGANPRTILLLTDGLENTGPMTGDGSVKNAIGGIDINAIGYGNASDLDGDLLTKLAQAHNGSYVRADSSLHLEKYFAQAFGNIFESGLLSDPEFTLADEQYAAAPYPFRVCGEETITIVVGWDNLDTTLFIEVKTPGGASFQAGAPGTETATGKSWTFLRVPLPHNGERDGAWQVIVWRPHTGPSEFPDPAPATRYFVNVVAKGGPTLRRVPGQAAYHTGDPINPLVFLSYGSGGGSPDHAAVKLVVTRPKVSAGNLLSQAGLKPPVTIGGDTIPARQATLKAIEAQTGQPAISYAQTSFDLAGGPDNTNGAFESVGLYGKPIEDLLTIEGNYTFHWIATYGEGCVSSRELIWSLHVDPSVDPTRSGTTTTQTGTRPDGTATGTVTITPRDPYGNDVGPGRGGGLTISGGPGTTVTGPARDNGDGSYTVPVTWDPGAGGPVVVVGQPGRPPVVLGQPCAPAPAPAREKCWWCMILCAVLFLVAIVLFFLWWHHM